MRDAKIMRYDINTIKTGGIFFLPVILSFLLFLGSCQSDDLQFEQAEELNKGNLTLQINLPDIQDIPTYAASAINENDVQTIDVLVFNADDNKFLYHATGNNIANGSNANQKTFNVKIKQNSGPSSIYLFVIANAKTQVNDALSSGIISVDKKQDDVMRNLTFSSAGKWGVPPDSFTRFPMWGQSGNISLTASTVTVDPIFLIRAVAKIDVGINLNSAGVFLGLGKVFKLEEIYLYNSLTGLLVCPDPDNFNSVLNKVERPSVPSSATVNSFIQYLVNDQNENPTKISFTNRIYTGEHLAGSNSNEAHASNLCLVVGGRFGNETTEGTVTTYYRVDFIKTTRNSEGVITQQEYLPVLRNHHYRVNITKVQGPGYSSIDEAFNAMSLNTNLMVEISDNDGDIKDIVYDGQYMLGVNQSNYSFDKAACTGKGLIVSTTYPGGWNASSNRTWLSIQNASNSTSGKSTLKFDLETNATAITRTGTITLQAGRMSKVITVVQSGAADVEFVGVSTNYLMDSSKSYSFNIKSPYAWYARVDLGNDPSNILQRNSFTTSGASNVFAGTPFSFKLVNDIVYQTIRDATVTFTIYSPTNQFEPVNIPIRGISIFDLGGLDVYGADLPASQNWAQYRDACTALPSGSGRSWRMPTDTELFNIYNATGGGASVIKYNFIYNEYYWSSTSIGSNYYARDTAFGTRATGSPSSTTLYCRCVRTKGRPM